MDTGYWTDTGFWIKLHTYWECKVSIVFAKLNIGFAFTNSFRNSSYSGVSLKKVTITGSVDN